MTGRTHQRLLGASVMTLASLVLLASACKVSNAPAPKKTPPVPVGVKGRQGPPAYVVGGFTADFPPQTLMPGDETFPCYIVPLNRNGPSRVVGAGMLTVGPGMHHGNITARPSTGTGVRPCPNDTSVIGGEANDIISGGSVLFGSSTQLTGTEWRTFPDGMGFPIGDDFEIVMRMHFLNATGAPVTVAPHYEWYTIDETKVSKLLGPFIWEYTGFMIPPLSTQTVTGQCAIPAPEHIVSLMPHMHKLATHFDATFKGGPLDGKAFLDSPGFNPDGVIESYDPSVDLSQSETTLEPGLGFGFSCTWDNTYPDKTIVEGVGVNEMCMAFGYAWPYESAYSAVASDGSCLVITPPYPKGWMPPTG